MAMTNRLKEITPERVRATFQAHDEKISSLADVDESAGDTEIQQQEAGYSGLAHISPMLREAFLNSGFSVEQAELVALGASLAVHTIIEIAEQEALPGQG